MPWTRRLKLAVRNLARRDAVAAELDEELRFHVEMEAAKNERDGMTPEDARRAALVAFGGVERHKEAVRDARGVRWLEELASDVRYALRGLRLRPGLGAAVVCLLALGIGANAAIFGVVDRLMLSAPAGVRDPGRVVRPYFRQTFSWAGPVLQASTSYPTYALLREQSRTLQVATYTTGPVSLGRGEGAQEVMRGGASASLFPVLGVSARLGRVFTDAEDRLPSGSDVVVLSDGFWRGHFGADRGVLGRRIRLGSRSYTVIGVLPPGFTGLELEPVDVWTPVTAAASEEMFEGWATSWGSLWLTDIARLRPGVSLAQAQAEATGLFRRALAAQDAFERSQAPPGERAGATASADATAGVQLGSIIPGRSPEGADAPTNARVSLWLAGVALLVLLVACANVASLLLARALGRRKEIALRLALGVGRGRLTRQLLVETVLLAALGGGAGLLLALAGGRVLRAVLLPGIEWQTGPLSGRVLAFSAALVVLCALLAGLAPALQGWRVQVGDALRSGMRSVGDRRQPLRSGLVVAQAALTVVLLVGAGLLVRSLRNLQAIPRGFEPERVLLVDLGLARHGYGPAEVKRLTGLARERLAHVAGVRSVALATSVPFRSSAAFMLEVPGVDSIPTLKDGGPYASAVSAEYFHTMGTRIVAGRAFNAADGRGAMPVAVVNATFARLVWPGQQPLGKCIRVGERDGPCRVVVGVAENALRQAVDVRPVMQYYVALDQRPDSGKGSGLWDMSASLLVRTSGAAGAATERVRRAVQSVSPDMPYAEVRPLAALIDPHVQPWRLGATMFTLFGVLALVVAALGIYGVVAYDVTQRTPELAIRMAVGAPAWRVLRLVLSDAVRLALLGLGLGSMAALVAGRAAAPLLYHESPHDPAVFFAVALLLLLMGAAAALLPARRASRVDPAQALRAE